MAHIFEQAPSGPPAKPRVVTHSVELLDGGWQSGFSFSPSGKPALVFAAMDGTRHIVYEFNDTIHLAQFAGEVEKFQAHIRASRDNGSVDDE